MNTQSENEVSKAYDFLKSGDLKQAQTVLENVLPYNLGNEEILYTIKCIDFWSREFDKASQLSTAFEQGESIVSQWKQFTKLMERGGQYFERSIYAVRQGIFSRALDYYQSMFGENAPQPSADLYRKVGLCYKKLGDYETALKYLESANSILTDSATILSEMADCYALCGEEKTAKVLFREAFFIDPQKVDTTLLDSELICYLIKQTAKLGYGGAVLLEWIPVYGVLYGVFTVKRELRAIEIGKLKQSIYALENGLKEAGNDKEQLVPRLINHYFWLIDHYITVNEDRSRINETLLKIKLLDIGIYEKYTM